MDSFEEFKVQRTRNFFHVGRVFRVYWPEPLGQIPGTDQTSVTANDVQTTMTEQTVFMKIRWFVVIRRGDGPFCSCLTIQTYGNQGVAKRGVTKGHHAIIYTSKTEPTLGSGEEPNVTIGEQAMLDSIRVVSEKRSDTMHPMARVNFAKIFTVEHNVKVYNFGHVHPDWLHVLKHQFGRVWRITSSDDEDDDDDDEDGDDTATERKKSDKSGSSAKAKKSGYSKDKKASSSNDKKDKRRRHG